MRGDATLLYGMTSALTPRKALDKALDAVEGCAPRTQLRPRGDAERFFRDQAEKQR